MGIYDREYYRTSREAAHSAWPQSAVTNIILICVICYLLDWVLFPEDHRLTYLLAANGQTLLAPWLWWKFLTYGFVHDPAPAHIILNMLSLFFLGREVESHYGTREFWCLYLAMIVFGGVVHALLNLGQSYMLLGASGAVCGVTLLFVLRHPFATLLLFPFPFPLPAWVVGLVLVVINVFGFGLGSRGGPAGGAGHIAFSVHLAGMAFAWAYYRLGWQLSSIWSSVTRGVRGRSFRVRYPDDEHEEDRREDEELRALEEEVDRILEKISQFGEASLTRKERRILEDASRRFRSRRGSRPSE